MRLIIILLLILNVNLTAFSATAVNSNISFSSSIINGKYNPAAYTFRYNSNTEVMVSSTYSDKIDIAKFENNEAMPYITNPEASVGFSFLSSNVVLDVNYIASYSNRVNKGNIFNIDNNMLLDLDISIFDKFDNLSVGYKTNIGLNTMRSFKAENALDLFKKPYSSYQSKTDLSFGVGALYLMGNTSFACTIDELFKIENSQLSNFDFSNLINSTNIGISYKFPRFDSFGQINNYNLRAGFELKKLNVLLYSVEGFMQLNNVSYLSLGTSYENNLKDSKKTYAINATLETTKYVIEIETVDLETVSLSFSYLF